MRSLQYKADNCDGNDDVDCKVSSSSSDVDCDTKYSSSVEPPPCLSLGDLHCLLHCVCVFALYAAHTHTHTGTQLYVYMERMWNEIFGWSSEAQAKAERTFANVNSLAVDAPGRRFSQ